jgi:hypothetical protein
MVFVGVNLVYLTVLVGVEGKLESRMTLCY